jgi:tetratricopeptide (TPR) repeat protein
LCNLGTLVLLKGDLDEAEALYREAIELAGDSVGTGWEGLGSVYMTAGRVDDAIAAYRTAIEKGGSSAVSGLSGLGGALGNAGRFEEAESTFRELLAADSAAHNGLAWYGLGEVYTELNRLDDARAAFHRAIESGPENVRELALVAVEKLIELE